MYFPSLSRIYYLSVFIFHELQTRQQELQTLGIFDTSDDFTLVVQPFFEGVTAPPLLVSFVAIIKE